MSRVPAAASPCRGREPAASARGGRRRRDADRAGLALRLTEC